MTVYIPLPCAWLPAAHAVLIPLGAAQTPKAKKTKAKKKKQKPKAPSYRR